jgi:type IV pilus assembly protein PilW
MTLHIRRSPECSTRPSRRQQGFTLIELLISMALGIVVIGALIVMYVAGSSATRNAQAQGQMNEDAQMALGVISQQLKQAGYNPTRTAAGARNDLFQGGWTLRACDTGFADNAAVNTASLVCNAAGANASLAVVYEADLNTGKNTAGGLPMDCIGNGVAVTAGGYYVMQSRIYIANNALSCSGSGDLTQSQVLAENIEALKVLFAVTEGNVPNSKSVRGYLTATQIKAPADAGLAALTEMERWEKVVAARVCVVVASENRVLSEVSSADATPTFLDCDGASIDINDGKLRRAYRTTVLLRNHGVGYVDS